MGAEVQIAGRVPQELSERVDRLANAINRNRSWIVEEALRHYMDEQEWQVQEIQEALDEYRAGKSVLIPHEQVEAEMAQLEAEIEAQIRATRQQ